jgi:mandelamide amidase
LRLAVGRRYWFEELDPEVERLTEAAFGRLRAAGIEIVEAEVPDVAELVGLVTAQVQQHDVRIDLPRYLERYGAKVGFDAVVAAASADIRETFARDVLPGGSGFVSEDVYRAAVDVHLPRLQANYRRYFAETGASAVVFPPSRVAAPPIGASDVEIGGKRVSVDEAVARNISAGSTAGLPGLVLPIGLTAGGLPVALEFDGPAGSDRALLALGLALERVLGKIPGPTI